MLLFLQIPKVQKKTVDLTVFYVLFGSTSAKVTHKMLVKLTTGGEQRDGVSADESSSH